MHIPILGIILSTLIFYSPILTEKINILNRGNDLQEQFWPVWHFIYKHFQNDGVLPFWNNLFFSGTPILPDPQFSLFYPGNFVFFFLPTDYAFLTYFILHTFVGGIGAYLAAKNGFNISRKGSLFTAVLYIFMPRLGGYLEAGHYGLVGSHAWVPFALLSVIKITKKPELIWSVLLAIAMSSLFFTHTVNFILVSVASLIVFATPLFLYQRKKKVKASIIFMLSSIITLGLTALTLLPQLEWLPLTTRYLLLETRDVYPKWNSIFELLQIVFTPITINPGNLKNIDVEKWLVIGTIPLILATVGFFCLKSKIKIVVLFCSFLTFLITALITANNISPLYEFFLSYDWYVLMRVSTRVWVIPATAAVFMAGFGYEKLIKKWKSWTAVLALFAILESLYFSWSRLTIPIPSQTNFASQEVYEFLAQDKDIFRVFCVNRCLSQKKASVYGLQLVEGYNTIQQVNYFKHSWQLMGGYWNYYTLSLPPTGTYKFEQLKPDAKSLGNFNTKYIISPYKLVDKDFVLEKQFHEYYVYKNSLVKPRAYFWTEDQKPGNEAKILSYSPNKIKVDTSLNQTARLVLAEVWSPGWKAYLNGNRDAVVQEKPDTLRLVDIKPDTKFVDFVYEPKGLKIGSMITLTTLLLLGGFGMKQWVDVQSLSKKKN